MIPIKRATAESACGSQYIRQYLQTLNTRYSLASPAVCSSSVVVVRRRFLRNSRSIRTFQLVYHHGQLLKVVSAVRGRRV